MQRDDHSVRWMVMLVAVASASATGGGCDPGTASGHIDAAPGGPDAAAGADGGPGAPDAATPQGPLMVYVGGGDDQIHVFALDAVTLALTPAGTVATGAGPSFLAFDPERRWLVAVNEGGDAVESFAIASATGLLTRVDGQSTAGNGPAHVAVDHNGLWVLVANYGDGSAAVLPIAADGTLGPAVATVTPGANAHQIITDATNAVAYVPCLGANAVSVFGFDAITGALSARPSTPSAAGAGPRHIALHPDGLHAYVINETASTVTTYTIGGQGVLTASAAPALSTLPPGFMGTNTGAEIAIHPSGKWLYTSNRGDDSIAVFGVDGDGALTRLAVTKTGGARPRHFSLVPGGAALLVANQDSGTIHGFRIDPQSGLLTPVGELAAVPTPQFVEAVRLP